MLLTGKDTLNDIFGVVLPLDSIICIFNIISTGYKFIAYY
jgi:hypothetical protein